ncbi:hypothetical protein FHS14_005025 [Paenibacillus baekrokdamisoli]|nr:hypothetical protein [Paenibacillus baekrokdamisoli]
MELYGTEQRDFQLTACCFQNMDVLRSLMRVLADRLKGMD